MKRVLWNKTRVMTKKVIRKYYRDGIEYRIKFPWPKIKVYEFDFTTMSSLPAWWTSNMALNNWLVSWDNKWACYLIEETDLTDKKVTLECQHYEAWSSWSDKGWTLAKQKRTWNGTIDNVIRQVWRQWYPDYIYKWWDKFLIRDTSDFVRDSVSDWSSWPLYPYWAWEFYQKRIVDFKTGYREWNDYRWTSDAGTQIVHRTGTMDISALTRARAIFSSWDIYVWVSAAWPVTANRFRYLKLTIE